MSDKFEWKQTPTGVTLIARDRLYQGGQKELLHLDLGADGKFTLASDQVALDLTDVDTKISFPDAADIAAIRLLSSPADGTVVVNLDDASLWVFDIDSTASDDGVSVLEPAVGAGAWLLAASPSGAPGFGAAGVATASKGLVLGVSKNVDTLVIAASGLKIGAGAGTAVTTTAAELNVNAGVVAGTSSASKTAVLGANKNLDILALPVSGLKIGAGAGTAVTSSAAELNILTGVTATAAELNNAADDSLHTQALVGAGAITVDGSINHVTLSGGAYAFTLAAPSAAMRGKLLTIEYIGGDTDADTLSLANVQGGSAATTASFNADNETLILVGGVAKWNVVKEIGVTLS